MQQRLPRLCRQPERFSTTDLTDRDLQIIATIERYRFIPTSLLVRLIPGSSRGIQRRLQALFHTGLLNRFFYSNNAEAVYYLDDQRSLLLLVARGERGREELDFQIVRRNRESDYARAVRAIGNENVGASYLFLNHELMISRFHATLELAGRASEGKVELAAWRQGRQLWQRVEVPKVSYRESDGTWSEDSDKTEILPHRPDAFFSLRFPGAPAEREFMHFFYEADRKTTTNTIRRKKKLRAHFHYVVREGLHRQHYGVDRIRAVLIETLDQPWAELLRQEAAEWVVSRGRPTRLFWFLPSDILLKPEPVEGSHPATLPRYLARPDTIFRRLWATPLTDWDQPEPEFFSLLDH
jgi:hypothetical protein